MSAHIVSQRSRLSRREVFVSGVLKKEEVGSGLLSHGVAPALPSTLVDFTTGFGMGPGVSPPLLPPTPLFQHGYDASGCCCALWVGAGPLRCWCRGAVTSSTRIAVLHSRCIGTLRTEQDRELLLQAQDTHRLSPRALVRVRLRLLSPYTSRLSNWSSTSALTRLSL